MQSEEGVLISGHLLLLRKFCLNRIPRVPLVL